MQVSSKEMQLFWDSGTIWRNIFQKDPLLMVNASQTDLTQDRVEKC